MVRHGSRLWDAHPHVRTGTELHVGERAADALKKWFGTWTALGFVAAWITLWWFTQADPGHLNLNLTLSCVAAVQGIVLQIAANRGDRINAEVALGTHANSEQLLTINGEVLQLQQQQMQILSELRALRQQQATTEGDVIPDGRGDDSAASADPDAAAAGGVGHGGPAD